VLVGGLFGCEPRKRAVVNVEQAIVDGGSQTTGASDAGCCLQGALQRAGVDSGGLPLAGYAPAHRFSLLPPPMIQGQINLAPKSFLAVPGRLAVTNKKDGSHDSIPGIRKQSQNHGLRRAVRASYVAQFAFLGKKTHLHKVRTKDIIPPQPGRRNLRQLLAMVFY
jgi:hypothetical protein